LPHAAIALSPHGGGRYMMTGSFDRTTKHWDLENTSTPITVYKRGSVTDGVWLTHWVSAVNSLDDSYS
jgi:WD40 repeat protein